MSTWKVTKLGDTQVQNPIFVEGLPGIGNVGKIAVDFLIEELKAKKIYDIFSFTLPHSVFVNEKNLVELPSISIFHKSLGKGKSDLLFLAGDVQPIDEVSSYEFSQAMINLLRELEAKEIITLGGIGLPSVPKQPKVYATGNSKEIIGRYIAGTNIETNIYGVVGPIVGVSGLLLGLAKPNMKAVSLLAETYGNPMYLGIRGARELVEVLNTKLGLNIDLEKLDKEIKEIESETEQGTDKDDKDVHKSIRNIKKKFGSDVSYIG